MHLRTTQRQQNQCNEQGQTTIALGAVLAVACLGVLALALIAQAMVHRARARNGADAVALAMADDPAAAPGLIEWYGQRGVRIERDGDHTVAYSGPSQAAAWAEVAPSKGQVAPALVAIVARAEQLTGATLVSVRWLTLSFDVDATEATQLRSVAAELGLCEVPSQRDIDSWRRFELC